MKEDAINILEEVKANIYFLYITYVLNICIIYIYTHVLYVIYIYMCIIHIYALYLYILQF